MIILVMGVSGSGKTSVGQALARRLSCSFTDADSFHSDGNRAKMAAGIALTDADRLPWLRAIGDAIREASIKGGDHVFACSALKEDYRRILDPAGACALVYLRGSPALLADRLAGRRGHFFNPDLLQSQLDTLEEPGGAIIIDIAQPLEIIVDVLIAALTPASGGGLTKGDGLGTIARLPPFEGYSAMTVLTLSAAPRPLGKSDLSVHPLAWGMWRMSGDVAAARERVAAARDIGITLFDTADIYGIDSSHGFGSAEALLGDVLKAEPGWRREMVIATKGGIAPGTPYNSSAAYLQNACEASLKRLGIERIDLYQIHRPDLLTHPSEVAEGLTRLKRAGKIDAVGVSNYTTAQTAALQAWLDLPLVSHQPEFSPVHLAPLTDGVLDQAMERDMAVLAWSPLGGGRIAGQPADGPARAVIGEIDRIAVREGVSRACLALAWVMTHPSRPIPIVGSQSPEHIRQMADVFKVRLDRADWYAVLVAARGAPMP